MLPMSIVLGHGSKRPHLRIVLGVLEGRTDKAVESVELMIIWLQQINKSKPNQFRILYSQL